MEKDIIKIIVDTREQNPWLFIHQKDIVVIRKKLDVGDYALLKEEPDTLYPIVIEKKSLSDFISCVGQERQRFEAELKRMTQQLRYLLIIGSLEDIYTGNFRSKINIHSVRSSLWDWTIEYHLIPIFVTSDGRGQEVAYDIFKMYLHNLKNKAEGSLLNVVIPPFVSKTLAEAGEAFLPQSIGHGSKFDTPC